MNVLIACEESQSECIAFRKKGHNAFSCDIQRCSGGFPEYHIHNDVIPLINGNCDFLTSNGDKYHIDRWDLLIAHPPCTYLCCCGSFNLIRSDKSMFNLDRHFKGLAAKNFFMQFYNANVDRICIENPKPMGRYHLPEYSQIVNPLDFGSFYSKRTFLWLKNLPPLFKYTSTKDFISFVYTRNGSVARSKSFDCISKAMAEQWG